MSASLGRGKSAQARETNRFYIETTGLGVFLNEVEKFGQFIDLM